MMEVDRLAVALTRSDIGTLERSLEGELLRPGEEEYQRTRMLFNGMIDRKPALIVRCAGAGDAALGIGFARKHHVPIAIKGCGHAVSGAAMCDDGIVLDMSGMSEVEIDEDGKKVRCGPGLSWGRLNDLALEKGLVAAGGSVSSVGVAGSTLGGGVGPLMGKFGLSCDNLSGAEVVTADGTVVHASREENRELLWGLRGGGGNFGVVTSMELRLHPVGEVYGGAIAWPMDKAEEVLQAYRRLALSMPDELGIALALIDVPLLGPAVGGVVCFLGEAGKAEDALEPLFRGCRPEIDGLGRIGYRRLGHIADGAAPSGMMNHWRSGFLLDLDDRAIRTMVRDFSAVTSDLSAIHLRCHHGAVTRVPVDATAFPHRRVQFNVHIMSMWRQPLNNARNINWTNEVWRDLRSSFTGATYANFADASAGSPRELYGDNLERLIDLKDRYDPENMFRSEHNVPPSSTEKVPS